MIILAGLCLVAAVISAVFVHDSRVAGPRFAAPAPYHGCALPDMGTAEHPVATTARTSETS
jgi:hypothetical protein